MPDISEGKFSGQHLVIFGCGYVGGAVARQAVAGGVRVTALTRNRDKAEALRAVGATAVVADLASDTWHREIPGKADFVLNAVSSGGGGMAGYRHSYVDGMRSILQWACATGPVGTFVYTSSTSVYPQDGGVTVDETASTDGVGERGQVLLEAEEMVRAYGAASRAGAGVSGGAEPFGRYFILRLAGIYGPERHHLLEQVERGEMAGTGGHRLNLIHRDDIAAAIWAVFAAPADTANAIFNVADDGAVTKSEIAAWLAGRLGVPIPAFTGAPVAGRRAATPDRVIGNAALKRAFGWRPAYPSYREGYEQIFVNR